jgi:hypothetical protein
MKKTTPLVLTSLLSLSAWSFQAFAQDPAAAPAGPPPAAAPAPEVVVPAAPAAAPAPAPKKKGGSGPALGLDPNAPQVSGLVTTTSEAPAAVAEPVTGEWKFDVTGYFRAPLRFSWGPPTTQDPFAPGNPGTQIRTPPLVPDANYIDWRYTNSMVGPWTELNFHYGNDRVKATVQIASYNVTDSGYRRLESNLGINEAFLSMTWPEFVSENARLTLIAGAYTNRYGAAGRYDAGRYETYLFGRTHTAGGTLTYDYDWNDWTGELEGGFGGKLEPIPFYGPPQGNAAGNNANQNLPAWEPYPGPVPQESTFVAHAHAGAVFKKEVIIGAHLIYVFSNDNERAGSYQGGSNPSWDGPGNSPPVQATSPARQPDQSKPSIAIYGADVKLLGGVLGDGYIGFSHLSATNALYLADAIEVLHSFGGWQLHDNYFGRPGGTDQTTGTINSVEVQYSFSFGQLFHYPQAFWGDGPDLIGTVFGMYNKVNAPMNPTFSLSKLKFGTEWTYVPLPWLGLGGRYDVVEPNLDNSTESFSVISPRIIFRTAFVTHEQVMIQYSRYFYGSGYGAGDGPMPGFMSGSQYPYNSQLGAANLGVDKNAAQIAAIIWF